MSFEQSICSNVILHFFLEMSFYIYLTVNNFFHRVGGSNAVYIFNNLDFLLLGIMHSKIAFP